MVGPRLVFESHQTKIMFREWFPEVETVAVQETWFTLSLGISTFW